MLNINVQAFKAGFVVSLGACHFVDNVAHNAPMTV